MTRFGSNSGFTLLEVIVALVIAMLALSAMMAVIMPARQSATLSRQFIEATRLARSHLESLGTEAPLAVGELGGADEDGYAWRAKVKKLSSHIIPGANNTQLTLALFDVEIVERWRGGWQGHSVTLHTRKLATESGSSP